MSDDCPMVLNFIVDVAEGGLCHLPSLLCAQPTTYLPTYLPSPLMPVPVLFHQSLCFSQLLSLERNQ